MSSMITRLLTSLNSLETSLLVFVSFLLFYTMYDKVTRRLVPANLIRIITLQEGIDRFLVEFNKALSLSGLSVLCFSFFPIYTRRMQNSLLWSAMLQLWTHALYSVVKYYGTKNIPVITSFLDMRSDRWKKLSIITGLIAQTVLSLGYFSFLKMQTLALFGISMGLLHFYLMEIDHKFVLRVRPYAFVVFPLSFLGIVYGCQLM